MPLTYLPAGGASATIGVTEHSLPANAAYSAGSPQTVEGGVQVWVDAANIAAGDVYVLRVYEKVFAAGTQRRLLERRIVGPVADPAIALPALLVGIGWDVTLQKISGTDRVIGWSVRVQ